MMSLNLTKVIADGYYLHDYSRWMLDRQFENEVSKTLEYRLHIGYGLFLECNISIDKTTDKSIGFKYTLRGDQWGKERATNTFLIDNIAIFLNDDELIMPHNSYIVKIRHETMDVTGYIKEMSRKAGKKYRIQGENVEEEVRYRILAQHPGEYAGPPDYEFDNATMSDEVMERLLKAFEFGNASALGSVKENADGRYDGSIDIVSGYRLRFISDIEDMYLDDMEYILDWTSPDGDYTISANIDHLTSENHAFRMYGHRTLFDLYIGVARLGFFFDEWNKKR